MGPSEVLGPDVPSTPVTREALYALVWSEPMLKVAARYDVSSSYMGRICTLLNVPRPERGYWAKQLSTVIEYVPFVAIENVPPVGGQSLGSLR
jgi:hypothetical protein